ncbi:MAG: penicillin-binding protein 2 [Spirochaetaceae bacterium]|nr:penicillin-binding protein 2 [Spirochaetaceae bacterium]
MNNFLTMLSKYRLFTAGGMTGLILIIFVARLFNLQIVEGSQHFNRAQNISQRTIEIPAQRGRIFDLNGELLASNNDLFTISITPSQIPRGEVPTVLNQLIYSLNLNRQTIENRVPPASYRSPLPIALINDVDLATVAFIAENIEFFPGISWQSRPRRIYNIYGGIGSGATVNHTIGYVGAINSEEVQMLYNLGYRSGHIIGKTGIENRLDLVLRGQNGTRFSVVDARGQNQTNLRRLDDIAPQHGNDIRLTIDMRMQRLVEEALGHRQGSIVVLRPATGAIIAMVSNPVFNANLFDRGGATSFSMQAIDPLFPFINRAISSVYPAASPFKLVIQTAILEELVATNRFDPATRIFCSGSIVVGDRIFRCWNRTGHGWLDLSGAIAWSCNTYFWTMVQNHLGRDAFGRHDPAIIEQYARLLGLGNLTEIDLPGERDGLIPSAEWKEDTWHSAWTGGDTINMTIGQGFVLVTPLQMANLTAMIANSGVSYRPHVLQAIINRQTGEEIVTQPTILHQADHMRAGTWQRIQNDMRNASIPGRGTGWMLGSIPIAGKTGTGETGIAGSYHDWYVGFAPHGPNVDPMERIVVVVHIEAGENYNWWSTRAANIIFQGYFNNQDYFEVLRTLQPGWQVANHEGVFTHWRNITGDPWPVWTPPPAPPTSPPVAVTVAYQETALADDDNDYGQDGN